VAGLCVSLLNAVRSESRCALIKDVHHFKLCLGRGVLFCVCTVLI
jgi:hypothetical protein